MQVGRVLAERYEIRRLIAEGGIGAVWAARDLTGGAEVAVKTVSLDQHGWRAEVRDRFLQEARLLEVSPHRNLVAIHDVGETDDGYLFLVLELLEGETLAERMARAPRLDGSEALELGLGIAQGLAALHERGIVHRDIKPANIVLHQPQASETTSPQAIEPKLIDLGISKMRAVAADPELFATLTATGQIIGTPQYMSHEQAVGDRDVDARSDIWSFGIVLYEMLTGRTPFAAPNVNAVLAAIRNTSPTPIRSVVPSTPDALARIVDRCLEKERTKRYASAAELVEALEAASKPPTPAARSRWPLRARLAAAVVALCLLGLLAARLLSESATLPTSTASAAPSSKAASAAPTPRPPPDPTAAGSAADAPDGTDESEGKPSAMPTPPPRSRPGSVTKVDDPGF